MHLQKQKTIPASIMVLLAIVLSILEEKTITPYTVINPHKKPINGNVNCPRNGIDIPRTITNPAPKDAPDDTPRVYGDANSFLSIDWTTDPLTAKHPPTIKANNTLGSLSDHIIDISFGSIPSLNGKFITLFKIIFIVSNI